MAELLARVNIRDVYFYHGSIYSTDAIVQSYACVCISACIKHDAIVGITHLLHLVNHLAFYVALKIFYFHLWEFLSQRFKIALHAIVTIDSRFANSEKVEVWTVKNEKFHYVKFLIIYNLTSLSIINYLYHRVAELCYDVEHIFGKITQGLVYDFIGNLVVGFGD